MTDAEELRLTRMPISDILLNWKPGSRGDDWTWRDEYIDLLTRDVNNTRSIIHRAWRDGLHFADKEQPILLGSDGRVWDGHHRICVALLLGIRTVNVDIAPGEKKERTNA